MSGFSLFELFKADAEGQLATLNDGLLRLERDPADRSVVEPLMRAAHSIKGAARIVGLDVIVQVAHAMEDCFVAVQREEETIVPARVDQLLRGADLLAAAAALDESTVEAWSAANDAEAAAVSAAIRAAPPVEATESTSPPEAPAPSASGGASGDPPADAPETGPEETAGDASAPTAPASSPPPPSESGTGRVGDGEPIRVSADRLERIMQLAGELMVAGRRLESVRHEAAAIKSGVLDAEAALADLRSSGEDGAVEASVNGPTARRAAVARERLVEGLRRTRLDALGHVDSMDELSRRTEELSAALYGAALGSRMRPFADVAAGFPRMVRDIARQLGKKVRFEVHGDQVSVDRELLARMEAPITHMLRNCLDHGVEMPADRRAAGKPEEATVVVEARHHAGRLVVRVSDDGGGIDAEAVRQRAIDRDLASAELAAGLGEAEVLEFLFLPGFSTASAVTELSGRGVGLDIVQAMVHEVGGSVRVESRLGEGSAFTMTLPVAVSVVRAAVAVVAGEPVAFPLARLERVVRLDPSEIGTVQGRRQFTLDAHSVGLVEAARLLDLGTPTRDASDRLTVFVLSGDREWYGLLADDLLGEEDLVVRALDPRLGKVPHVASAALLESGDPVIIVDTDDLVSSMRQQLAEGRILGGQRADESVAERARRVLVVDDSATVREIERQLLTRAGYDVDTAVDGVDGWNALSAGSYDLLVTDVDMPRMNGLELVRRVRADERFRVLPVVVVSYKDREEDRLRGLDAGANAYLTKGSFQDDSFIRAVQDLVGAATT